MCSGALSRSEPAGQPGGQKTTLISPARPGSGSQGADAKYFLSARAQVFLQMIYSYTRPAYS